MIITIDLSNFAQHDVDRLRDALSEELLKRNTRFNREICERWDTVSNANPTKKEMVDWCNAEYTLYVVISQSLHNGVNKFNIGGMSPMDIWDFRNLLNSWLTDLYYCTQLDLMDETDSVKRNELKIMLTAIETSRENIMTQFNKTT